MNLGNFIGPATIVYLISATVAALWWASDINSRVKTVESSTVNGERIARLETQMGNLAESNRELKGSVNTLLQELRER